MSDLSKLTASKSSIAYQNVIQAIQNAGRKIYVNRISGKGRFTSSSNRLTATIKALQECGAEYETGNDSPRGGRMGDWIMLKINKNTI